MNVREFLRERGFGGAAPSTMPTGASIAYVFGATLVMMLVVEAVTGAALAAFYSPSTRDAWASVAYVNDQAPLGWLVRGIHVHGAGALAILSGIHLVQTAAAGAYQKPREVVWWLGLLLMVLILAWAVTGYVLRWDQAGYWANQVEIGIAAATPVIGGGIRSLAIGGNGYGNLTLTRFYMLHVIAMPVIVFAVTVLHVRLARKHGPTPVRRGEPSARWPEQSFRDAAACAVVFAVLLAFVIQQHGADLAAPADPAAAYDARPLWYFRWLFELRELAGSFEKIVAMAAPAIVGGILFALPLLKRKVALGAVGGVCALVAGLTVASFVRDHGNADLAKRDADAEKLAKKARKLAIAHGVPVDGNVFESAPMYRARTIYAQKCAGCHDATSKDRKGPIIAAGHGNRAWLEGMIRTPGGDAYWGHTQLSHREESMQPTDLPPEDLAALVESLYAESDASDVEPNLRERGAKVFSSACDSCHSRDEDTQPNSSPVLYGLGSRAYYGSFIGNPKSPLHMGKDKSEMPRFDAELSVEDRDALAQYLVWLRTATPDDVTALGEL
ncbi:MAG TPA: cytochrome b N-terminal domain-containing protein [Kofleriaceae bacterium]